MDRNPPPAAVEKFIEELYARGTTLGEDAVELKILPMSLAPERGGFLREVCRAERPAATIEIGMAYGLSTLFILQTLLESGIDRCAHTVMDPFQTSIFHDAGRRVIKEAGVEQLVDFHQDHSEYVLPRLLREGRRFDMAFIDGNHRFDHVFVDLFYIDRLLKPSGVVVLDDCFLNSVHFACRFVQTNYGYSAVAQYPPTSIALDDEVSPAAWRPSMRAMRKPTEPPPSSKFHFVRFYPLAAPQDPAEQNSAKEDGTKGIGPPTPPAEPSPRVMANRLRRDALMALEDGDRRAARAGFASALKLQPFHVKTYFRMLRTFFPQSMVRVLSSPVRRRKLRARL
jgi:predicted O-methyltransferase YrrM